MGIHVHTSTFHLHHRIHVRKTLAKDQKAKSKAVQSADFIVKLRLSLSKLWSRYREREDPSPTKSFKLGSEETTNVTEVASFSLLDLRHWLRQPEAGQALHEWGRSASDVSLRRVLRVIANDSPLRQQMGFRFKDPSKSGTWSVENLKGFNQKRLGRLPVRRWSEMSWHCYLASFKLRLSNDQDSTEVSIERTLKTKRLAVRMEKRRQGEVGGPLARELVHVTAHSRRELAKDGRKRIKIVRRAASLLPAVIIRPVKVPNLPRWTLIYLHGMGSSALGSYADRPHYFFDGTAAVKVIIPTAPSREVSCFDSWWSKIKARESGASKWTLQKFFSWYDYTSNHGGRKEDSLDWHSLHAMQRALHKIIDREAAELGGRTDRIILGGKSQGCATSLDAALTYPKKLGGFIGLVGHLLSCTPVDANGPQASTPFHFYHEVEDDIMQWHWVQRCEQRLRTAGYNVQSSRSRDPEGCGHFIGGIEGQWIRRSLRQITGS